MAVQGAGLHHDDSIQLLTSLQSTHFTCFSHRSALTQIFHNLTHSFYKHPLVQILHNSLAIQTSGIRMSLCCNLLIKQKPFTHCYHYHCTCQKRKRCCNKKDTFKNILGLEGKELSHNILEWRPLFGKLYLPEQVY